MTTERPVVSVPGMSTVVMVICLSLHSQLTWSAAVKQVSGARKENPTAKIQESHPRNERSIYDNRIDTYHPPPPVHGNHFGASHHHASFHQRAHHAGRHAYSSSYSHAPPPSYGHAHSSRGGHKSHAHTSHAPLDAGSLLSAILSGNSEVPSPELKLEPESDPWLSEFPLVEDFPDAFAPSRPLEQTPHFFGSSTDPGLDLGLEDAGAHNSHARASLKQRVLSSQGQKELGLGEHRPSLTASLLNPALAESKPAHAISEEDVVESEDAEHKPLDLNFLTQALAAGTEADGNMAPAGDLFSQAAGPADALTGSDLGLDLTPFLPEAALKAGEDVMAEFMEFLALKERGAVNQCFVVPGDDLHS